MPQKIFKIIASGTNLEEMLCNPAIDPYLTNSNNIIDTYNIFGIEAARELLLRELFLRKTLEPLRHRQEKFQLESERSSDLKKIYQKKIERLLLRLLLQPYTLYLSLLKTEASIFLYPV